MKLLTKLTIAGEPMAKTFALDVEAGSPEEAGRYCVDHCKRNWMGPSPTTETTVYVYKYAADGVTVENQVVYSMLSGSGWPAVSPSASSDFR